MDFTKYMDKKIGSRIRKRIKNSYKSDVSFLEKLVEKDMTEDFPIQQSALSNIKNGKKSGKYLMSQKIFSKFLEEFELTSQELLFGENEEILEFFKFSFLLVLLNNSGVPSHIYNFTDDKFFQEEIKKENIEEVFEENDSLIKSSNKLLRNILVSGTEESINLYFNIFKNHYDDETEFIVDFGRLVISNKLRSDFLFEAIFSEKDGYATFIQCFNNFIKINTHEIINFFNRNIGNKLNEESNGPNDSVFSKLSSEYFNELFSSDDFLFFLDQTLDTEQFIIFITRSEKVINEIATSRRKNSEIGREKSIVNINKGVVEFKPNNFYYDKEKLDEDKKYLEEFYYENKDAKIKNRKELRLNIFDFINLQRILENELFLKEIEEYELFLKEIEEKELILKEIEEIELIEKEIKENDIN
ncbi:hypothetical protein [Streptococcus parasanguinis]|nr:hypothetical protein [Streptococcus parasanguinis]